MPDSPASYDPIAGLYHALWFDWYLPAALPGLERLFFSQIPSGARVLDVCCGSGHVTKELVSRGYRVTGIDVSSELIAIARQHLPLTDLRVHDVRKFNLEERYDSALSTFDSFNHLLIREDLRDAFTCVHQALKPRGLFVFDMNLDEAYTIDLDNWSVDVHDNSVGMFRGEYNRETRRARTELLWFSRTTEDTACWQQRRSVVHQKCYSREEILSAVKEAGFVHPQLFPATEVGVQANLGYGRVFVTARAAA